MPNESVNSSENGKLNKQADSMMLFCIVNQLSGNKSGKITRLEPVSDS